MHYVGKSQKNTVTCVDGTYSNSLCVEHGVTVILTSNRRYYVYRFCYIQ